MRQLTVQCETHLQGRGRLQVGIVGTLFSKTDVQIDRIVQSGGEPLAVWQFSKKQIDRFVKCLKDEANKL